MTLQEVIDALSSPDEGEKMSQEALLNCEVVFNTSIHHELGLVSVYMVGEQINVDVE